MRPGEFHRVERGILDQLASAVRKLLFRHGAPVTEEQRQRLVDELFPLIRRYRQRLYALSVEELVQQSEALQIEIPVPVQRRYQRVAVEKMVTAVMDPASPVGGRVVLDELDSVTREVTETRVVVDEAERHNPVVVGQIADRVVRGAEHHAHAAGRDTIQDAVESTWVAQEPDSLPARGETLGYARVLTGAESCSFCAMLASRGPVYESADSAGAIKVYHYGCDCVVRLVLKDEPWEGMDEWQALADLWDTDTRGSNGRHLRTEDARRAFRRNWEKRMRQNGGEVDKRFVAPSFRGS